MPDAILRLALPSPLRRLFDYRAPPGVSRAQLQPGMRVRVPFGRREMIGILVEVTDHSEVPAEKLKPAIALLDATPPLPPALFKLCLWTAQYYQHSLGDTLSWALPVLLRQGELAEARQERFWSMAPGARLEDPRIARAPRQREALATLAQHPHGVAHQLLSKLMLSKDSLDLLLAKGLVQVEIRKHAPDPRHEHWLAQPELPLNPEQRAAYEAIRAGFDSFHAFLLAGVTGSGKTEVYVHLMHDVLQRGGQVLLLVPEINLTPQLEQYFRSRFPDVNLISLHSGLSEGERLHNWQQAQAGAAQIVLGTRLAVFAELPGLALIIVDEEHDSSFKQQDGLRYSARDVAIFRASQHGIPIVLGSATPSLESYHNAQSGRYRMLKLTGRALAEARLPAVRCININQTVMHHGISENLLREIGLRIARNEQSLLFINRRGYAPVLMCTGCGWLSSCRHCAGKMVLHLNDKRLRCHHCGYQLHVPHACPSCGNAELHPVGSGTQRVESVLQERFPDARILRVDRDSTRNKRAWQTMREQIHANEVDILVGTQMLAKGHDFPALTLVGVLNPDSALYSSDFRAAEKLFAQLVQVAGRAGRADKPGEVIIQTAFPDHPLFLALQAHDFEGWAAAQLAERQMAGFPPFVYQAMLRAEGKQETGVYAFLNQARAAAVALQFAVEILGVVPAALPRRANHIRAQLLIQGAKRKDLQQFLRAWQPLLDALPAQKLRWSLDIDPLEF